jgi:hypothetical protein
MAKTWVLDTETKGTGAHIAPLNSEQRDRFASGGERELALVTLERPPRPVEEPVHEAQRFRVVDVLGAQVLGEGIGVRETLALLAGMRSALDARISVWVPDSERWRLLSLEEHRTLWGMRELGAANAL